MKTLFVREDLIENIYEDKRLSVTMEDLFSNESSYVNEPDINSYLTLKSEINDKKSCVVRYCDHNTIRLLPDKLSLDSIKPKDVDQSCLIDALLDEQIKIISVTGPAGSGKSFLVLAWAIFEILKKGKGSREERKLLITKPAEMVSSNKFFGAVPGGNDEKFAPFLENFKLTFAKIMKDEAYAEMLMRSGKITFKPIEFMRGDSRDNTILVADEVQNLNFHQVKTAITRMGENSKVIFLGDTKQKDVKSKEKSGFELMHESFTYRDSSITSHIHLTKDYRGPISLLMSKIADEVEP